MRASPVSGEPLAGRKMELHELTHDVADALVAIDSSGVPFKQFQQGVGPYGEPQLVRGVAERLNALDLYHGLVVTKRCPDLLVKGHWAVEFKIARPFGDNGKEAENWSVNLLHPYEGNVSALGDCIKLCSLNGSERKAVIVVGYEHTPPRIKLEPLFDSFELIARSILRIELGSRVQEVRTSLRHPVHQQLTIAAWEVWGPPANSR